MLEMLCIFIVGANGILETSICRQGRALSMQLVPKLPSFSEGSFLPTQWAGDETLEISGSTGTLLLGSRWDLGSGRGRRSQSQGRKER